MLFFFLLLKKHHWLLSIDSLDEFLACNLKKQDEPICPMFWVGYFGKKDY